MRAATMSNSHAFVNFSLGLILGTVFVLAQLNCIKSTEQLARNQRQNVARTQYNSSQANPSSKLARFNQTTTTTTTTTAKPPNSQSSNRSGGFKKTIDPRSDQPMANLSKSTAAPINNSENTTGYSNRSSLLSGGLQARTMQQISNEPDDYRVPFWNVAHMINSIGQIEPALSAGANGIEVDVSFDKNGIPTEAYHGFPCDCGRHCHHREDFIKFVQHIGAISAPPESTRLQLILFDLKLKGLGMDQKDVAGRYLAKTLHEHLYKPFFEAARRYRDSLGQPPVRVIISINHVTDNNLVRSFISYMREHRLDHMSQLVGFDVGMNDSLDDISAMWNGFNGAVNNVWQGDGLTNCANIVRSAERLKEAISNRNGQGHFKKVYYWTADVMYQIRSVLRLGLDAILTNQPQRVVQVLQEPEFATKYRLATPYDDPFTQFWIQPSAWKISPPSLGEAVETVTNIRQTSANFVKTLPEGIAVALKKVQKSIIARR